MEECIGKLQVQVAKARDLSLNETSVLKLCNAYCVTILDKQTFKTKTVKDANPVWGQSYTFKINKPLSELEVTVWDENTIKSDELLGKVTIPLVDLSNQQIWQKWYPLKRTVGNETITKGDIQLELHYKYLAEWSVIYQGITALQNGSDDAALRYLNEAIQNHSDIDQLYGYRSEAHMKLQMFKEALEDAKEIIDRMPNRAEGYYRAGKIYYAVDEYEKAAQLYETGLKYDFDDVRCKEGLEEMKRNEIKHKVRKAIANGRKSYDKKDFYLALDYFNDAISLNPRNSSYYLYRALTYIAVGKLEEAVADGNSLVNLNPNWPKKNPIKQGYLMKQGQVNIMMKKRWCILKECFIFYYNTSKDLKPNGLMLLADFDLQRQKDLFIRVITPNRVFELKAESKADRDDWITILESPLNKQTMYPMPIPDEKEDEVYITLTNSSGGILDDLTNGFNDLSSRVFSTILVPGKAIETVGKKVISKFQHVCIENANKYGHMYKLGQIGGNWKKRLVIIKESSLYYLHHREESDGPLQPTTMLSPSGVIVLDNHCKIELAAEKASKEFAFELITPSRGYLWSTQSKEEMDEWIIAILNACGNLQDVYEYQQKLQKEQQKEEPSSVSLTNSADINNNNNNNNNQSPSLLSSSSSSAPPSPQQQPVVEEPPQRVQYTADDRGLEKKPSFDELGANNNNIQTRQLRVSARGGGDVARPKSIYRHQTGIVSQHTSINTKEEDSKPVAIPQKESAPPAVAGSYDDFDQRPRQDRNLGYESPGRPIYSAAEHRYFSRLPPQSASLLERPQYDDTSFLIPKNEETQQTGYGTHAEQQRQEEEKGSGCCTIL